MAILISGKVDFREKNTTRGKEDNFRIIWVIYQENITTLNICASTKRALNT